MIMLGNLKRLATQQISQAFKVGFPIRISEDQSLFAAPLSFSQRITSFFACACQGIHQLPLIHLIVLIAYAHHLFDLAKLSPCLHPCWSKRQKEPSKPGYPRTSQGAADRPSLANDMRDPNNEGYLLQPSSFNDAIDVFDLILFAGTPVHCEVRS